MLVTGYLNFLYGSKHLWSTNPLRGQCRGVLPYLGDFWKAVTLLWWESIPRVLPVPTGQWSPGSISPWCHASFRCFLLEDEQIVLAFERLMWIYVVLSSTCSSRRANRLGKIVFPDGQISDDLFDEKVVRSVCTSDDLFVWNDLSVQTICSSSSVKTAMGFK